MATSGSETLPVAVDAMGGDHGPDVVVDGVVAAARELNLNSILIGTESILSARLRAVGAASDPRISVQNASEVVTMEDAPSVAIRNKRDSSLIVAYNLVKDGKACAIVSPGNTGAMMAAGVFISGTLPGIVRPAIATLIPKVGDLPPTVLLDSGANVDCHASQLVQFALMGSFYAQAILPCSQPRVALLSNGSESTKGTDVLRSTALMLSNMPGIKFVGYLEGRDIPKDRADVIVCDGFVGNIVLKAMEGSVELVFDSIRHCVEKSGQGKLAMWLAKPIFKSLFRDKLDPSAYGGAPLLGLNDIAIVCHGSSDGRAIMNAVRVAHKSHQESLIEHMAEALSSVDDVDAGGFEDGIWNRMSQRFEKQRNGKRGSANKRDAAGGDPEAGGKDN